MSKLSRLDQHQGHIIAGLVSGKSKAEIARELRVPVSTLKSWLQYRELPIAGANRTEADSGVRQGEVTDPETLAKELGFDLDKWHIDGATLNRWGDNHQLKLRLVNKDPVDFVLPARDVAYQHPGFDPGTRTTEDPILIVVCGDQQIPYHDPALNRLFLAWLKENRPDAGVLIGDTLDFPNISRHKDNPEWNASVQECLDAGYSVLLDYVLASERTAWTKLIGNHDERIRNELLNRAERLYGIRPARRGDEAETEALSIRNLLHLDSLGIDYVDPHGSYEHAFTRLSDRLSARHGWLTGSNTAKKTLDRLGHSVLVGHTHAKSQVFDTTWDIDGEPSVRTAVEIGTMAQVKGGLGYAVNPNWQQGFATVAVWPDGFFQIEHANYVNGVLLWRDQRYE